ncbi:hypothetical protein BCR44DRAFT_1219893 [Catenaria anguillulae PL171]|uniref:Uncharacterized protein n=1 Tax=Catenaria anguillulae PL171 TaxID=765915 RepID=A0A1Y2I1Z9_9FUNG|nr:hypothetical protein BCR44DRAFT_1219893 [Catenaria anguillulae PL171]
MGAPQMCKHNRPIPKCASTQLLRDYKMQRLPANDHPLSGFNRLPSSLPSIHDPDLTDTLKMTSSIKILTLLLLLAATVSAQSPLEDCVRTFNAQTDCFKTKSTTSGAKLFTVEYKNYYKVITVNAPFKPPTNYTLYIRGAPRDGLPTNVNGTFEIPVRSVATFDTTTVPYIELLGRRSTIKAASSPEYFGVDDTFKFVKNNQVYALDKRTNPSAFLDWFESALVFPNVILQDIVAITNPAVKNVQRTYLRKVDSEKPTVLTKDQCSGDANAAMPVMGLNDAEIKSTIVAAPGNSASAAQGKLAAVVAAGVAAVAMIVA